jgi:hypothetical protein
MPSNGIGISSPGIRSARVSRQVIFLSLTVFLVVTAGLSQLRMPAFKRMPYSKETMTDDNLNSGYWIRNTARMNGCKCAGASMTRAHPRHSLQHETPVMKGREIRDNAVTLHCFGPIDDDKSRLGSSKMLSLSSESVGLMAGSRSGDWLQSWLITGSLQGPPLC